MNTKKTVKEVKDYYLSNPKELTALKEDNYKSLVYYLTTEMTDLEFLNWYFNEYYFYIFDGYIQTYSILENPKYILINNTKPLPKPLIYELLPEVNSELPSTYRDKQLPNKIISILNNQTHSPFFHAIKTHTHPEGHIKDNTILKSLSASLSDGILYELSEHKIGMNDIESMTNLLNAFWGAVEKTFPKDWKLDPKKTRLTHGAGMLSLSSVMEQILYKKILRKDPIYLESKSYITSDFEKYLEPLKEKIDWSKGKYDFGDGNIRSIMDIQNTSKDIDLFRNFILSHI